MCVMRAWDLRLGGDTSRAMRIGVWDGVEMRLREMGMQVGP